MRRVHGVKGTRITRGGLSTCHGYHRWGHGLLVENPTIGSMLH